MMTKDSYIAKYLSLKAVLVLGISSSNFTNYIRLRSA